MTPHLITLLTQPMLYALIVGWAVGMYVMWALARRQFLGVNQAMNLFCLSLIGAWLSAGLVQAINNLIHGYQPAWHWLIIHPTPWPLLIGWLGLWLTASWYIKRIRYPYWKMLDMLAVGLLPLFVGLISSWAVRFQSLPSIGLAVASLVIAIGLGLLYRRTKRPGLIFIGLWLSVFVLDSMARLMTPSWQVRSGIVEWLPDAIGVLAGLTLLILRLSEKSRQMVQDLPRGVSSGFRETFGRSLAKQQPSKSDGLSDDGGNHE